MTAAPVRLGSAFSCAYCDCSATWRVIGKDGREERACSPHLGDVAETVPTDGWVPLTLVQVLPARPPVAELWAEAAASPLTPAGAS